MYKALISFCSNELDIKQGDILTSNFASAEIIADLLEAGYIEEYTIPPVLQYKGTVSTYANLPSTNLTIGDVYNIETADSTHEIRTGDNVAWNGTTWDKLGGDIDLSGYQTKIDSSNKLSSDLVDDTNHTNLFVTASEKTTWNGKQDTLTAGTNITIEDNVINASGGTNLPVYVIKANVNNGFFATQNVLSPKTTEFTDILNDIAKNGYSSIIVNVYAPGSSIQTGCYGMMFQATDITLSESGGTISLSGVFFNQRSFSTYLQATFHKVSVSYSYSNNLYTCTNISETVATINCADYNTVLSKSNTTSYMPNSDYNPSTKLYTDKTHYENMSGYDSTKTQILKNIQGTLTWVDE